jgi:hypothetical protein
MIVVVTCYEATGSSRQAGERSVPAAAVLDVGVGDLHHTDCGERRVGLSAAPCHG